ncbi:peptidase [Staphylococcus gallinarum]|uniref:Peptidase n=1 Tax=Staphylococcus gallinarum TaxID=1293 RepID=A0A380FKK9_STAGA|nr:peptidase [Staphylococcus gallinarum]
MCLTYEQLLDYAIKQHGKGKVQQIIDEAIGKTSDLNLQSVAVVDELIQLCRDITPAVVTFFATPYYPAVNASDNQQITKYHYTCTAVDVN